MPAQVRRHMDHISIIVRNGDIAAGEIRLANQWIDSTTYIGGIEWQEGRAAASLNEGLAADTINSDPKQPLAFNLQAFGRAAEQDSRHER